MLVGVTHHMIPHLPGVHHLHVNRPLLPSISTKHKLIKINQNQSPRNELVLKEFNPLVTRLLPIKTSFKVAATVFWSPFTGQRHMEMDPFDLKKTTFKTCRPELLLFRKVKHAFASKCADKLK